MKRGRILFKVLAALLIVSVLPQMASVRQTAFSAGEVLRESAGRQAVTLLMTLELSPSSAEYLDEIADWGIQLVKWTQSNEEQAVIDRYVQIQRERVSGESDR